MAVGFYKIYRSLALEMYRTGENAFILKSLFNGILHLLPYGRKIIPDFRTFTFLYIFPIAYSILLTPLLDFRHGVQGIDLRGIVMNVIFTFGKRSSTHTVYCPFILY